MSSVRAAVRNRIGPFRERAWKAYLAAGTFLVALYYLVPPFKGSGVLFNLIGLSSAATIVAGVRLHKPKTPLAWYLFAAGQLSFVTGDAFYYGYNAIFHHDVPFPSLGDVFYLAVYPLLISGLLILLRRRNPVGDRASLIDGLILTTGLAVVSWVFLMAPYAHDPALSFVEKVASIAYPLMDICLLAVTIRLAVDRGIQRTSLTLLILSVVSLLTADSILGILTLEGGYTEGGLLDAGWAIYYLLWGAAALHPSMRLLEERVPNRENRLSRGRLALLTGASLMPPAVQGLQAARDAPFDLPVTIAGSAALFALVVARMAGLLRESERSATRERTLREAGKALIGARDREQVYHAGLASMQTLVGAKHEVRLSALSASGELLAQKLDENGAMKWWPLRASDMTSLDAARLRDRGTLELALDGSRLRPALHLLAHSTVGMVFPLFVRQELRGLVFVAGPSSFPTQMKDAMQTLAVKIALTLESTILAEDLHRQKSEARFQSLVQNSSDLITVIDAKCMIEYQSPSVERVLGYEVDELLGTSFADLLHPQERDGILTLLVDQMAGAVPTDVVECRLRHANGTWLMFEILRANLMHDPNVQGIVLNARDVSERKQFEQQLTHQAFHDPVTDLANRALFTNRVEHALARQTRDAGGLAVLFVDLDDFKVVNDSLGHAVGDQVLHEVGLRLGRCVRPMDTVARFGGDEFAILLEDIQRPDQAVEIADRIFESLEKAVVPDEKEFFIGVSIGIALLDGEDAMTSAADELMRNADVAMYRAKREGKGHYRVFEPEMHANALDRLELKGSLQRAIEREELELHFQPIVSLEGDRLSGFETLVRWNHPERGKILPAEFIPLAEDTGLIMELGAWILNEACRQMKFMQDISLLSQLQTVSVNISVRQLQQPDFINVVARTLESTGLAPGCLTLELTESVLMTDTEAMIAKLLQLKSLGIRLSVDDFGTGYSSLGYLSRFPVDVLKIDQTFVSQIDVIGQGAVLIAAIVKLGEALHLDTVAEGIETQDQADRLVSLGCPFGQGFFFSEPMDIDTTLEYLGARLSEGDAHGATLDG